MRRCSTRVRLNHPSEDPILTLNSYFRPKVLKYFGALQDGGIRLNNPSPAALWELCCIWPEHTLPHLFLSVGTGYQKPTAHELGPYRGIWLDGFVPRILRAFLSSPSLDAENSWLALENGLDDGSKERFFRLTLEFEGKLAALDDVSQIPLLLQVASDTCLNFDEIGRALWASRFFFEFLSELTYL